MMIKNLVFINNLNFITIIKNYQKIKLKNNKLKNNKLNSRFKNNRLKNKKLNIRFKNNKLKNILNSRFYNLYKKIYIKNYIKFRINNFNLNK